ncbi:hypothetical protein [Burkholderia seminalis]|uniref:hypothetical protein n=1 Tax=Burkholderia seminalis TaxID=488731 RepID=UPI001903EDE3|nr:hypothetical protein [Burkholderia seminalis]MBJ9966690.1 hypothetical protein [Burkholderia seminalis]
MATPVAPVRLTGLSSIVSQNRQGSSSASQEAMASDTTRHPVDPAHCVADSHRNVHKSSKLLKIKKLPTFH